MASPITTSSRRGVLIRPPNPKPPPPQSTPSPLLPPPPSSSPNPPTGVVVVGFIGRRQTDVDQLINRVLDANVFGSGNSDKDFTVQQADQLKDWFRARRISYFHDQERGIVYLQFSSTVCPSMRVVSEYSSSPSSGFGSEVEEHDFGDLQGMLFMFSVCHVIMFIQEGSRIDTHILKKFRILQAAKHAIAPPVKSRTSPSPTSRSSSSRNPVSGSFSGNRAPARSGAIMGSSGSAISIMSRLGSLGSLFPGQCTPAILFIFLDDFSDFSSGSNIEECVGASSSKLVSSSSLSKQNKPANGSGPGPVVVLARPVGKSEGGLRKKLQSSLEAQIRFLIKKCRTLSGSEPGHGSSRGGGLSNSAPLFSLDASKAVVLLDRSSNQQGESLDFASSLVEDVLNGKATPDSLLLESHGQGPPKEDILSVKEFVYKQADTLRGRGGTVTNASSGSVGMVAVAAAAAASSAASGKALIAPELPDLETWLSSSQKIFQHILLAKSGLLVENEIGSRKTSQRVGVAPPIEGMAQRATEPFDIAKSCLEGVKGFNEKFSTLWCQKALPAAKEVYLNELPACYPTPMHKAQMAKALHAFCSMVRGPAVGLFVQKLEDECTAIWNSGRQLCDSTSLTGKPCMYQRHGVQTDDGFSEDGMIKPHSSGFVFLQACACGRSRRLHSDPFDFETANVTSKCFDKCCKLLAPFELPQVKNVGPIQASSWSLIRLGKAKYYDPSKGLLQSGFCATQKFLLKWNFFLEKNQSDLLSRVVCQDSMSSFSAMDESIAGSGEKKPHSSEIDTEELTDEKQILVKPQTETAMSDNKKIDFGRGISNFTLRKPFSEVVAGTTADVLKFPPLQSSKQPSVGLEKDRKQNCKTDSNAEKVHQSPDGKGPKKSEAAVQKIIKENGIGVGEDPDNLFPKIGSNRIPMKKGGGEKSNLNTRLVNAYVGFEHECPFGHRFILTPEHLNGLDSSYLLPEEFHITSYGENSVRERPTSSKFGNDGRHGKPRHNSNGNSNIVAGRKVRNIQKMRDLAGKGHSYLDRVVQISSSGQEHSHSLVGRSEVGNSAKDIRESLHSLHLNDDALSLLNRNLPIFINCPHCRISKNKKDPPKDNFAGAISQLQRIFLVTPPFPVILAASPVIQFEASCLSPSVPYREQKLQFSFECPIILPPESFLSLKLPFIYGVQLENESVQSLRPFDHQPELTAWICHGTTLQVMSKEASLRD